MKVEKHKSTKLSVYATFFKVISSRQNQNVKIEKPYVTVAKVDKREEKG